MKYNGIVATLETGDFSCRRIYFPTIVQSEVEEIMAVLGVNYSLALAYLPETTEKLRYRNVICGSTKHKSG